MKEKMETDENFSTKDYIVRRSKRKFKAFLIVMASFLVIGLILLAIVEIFGL